MFQVASHPFELCLLVVTITVITFLNKRIKATISVNPKISAFKHVCFNNFFFFNINKCIILKFLYVLNFYFMLTGAYLRRAASQEAEKRRSSLGNVPTSRHRASDAFLDPHHAAILFRDSRGVSCWFHKSFIVYLSRSTKGPYKYVSRCMFP